MKNKIFLKKVLLLLLLSFSVSLIYADTIPRMSVIIKKPNNTEIEILGNYRPTNPNSPKVPEYIIKDNYNKFIMAIGGYIRPIFGFDIGNDLNNILFMPNKIPVPAKRGNKFAYTASPFFSALDFQLVALPNTKNQLSAYIQFMYTGQSGTVAVADVYITYRNFLMGASNTLIYDGRSVPLTIDPQGPNGAVGVMAYRLSYTSPEYKGFSYAIGLELPKYNIYTGPYHGHSHPSDDDKQFYGTASQAIPDIPAYIQYQGKGLNRIRLSGLLRNFYYRNLITDKTHSTIGWCAQLSGNIQPSKNLVFYYQATYGKGISNYIVDIGSLPISFIPQDDAPGKMKACPALGYLGGVRYNFTDKLVSHIKFSQTRVWGSGEYYPDYKYGIYAAANMFYYISPYLRYGVEYLWGRRQQFVGGGANANRVQTTLTFSF